MCSRHNIEDQNWRLTMYTLHYVDKKVR